MAPATFPLTSATAFSNGIISRFYGRFLRKIFTPEIYSSVWGLSMARSTDKKMGMFFVRLRKKRMAEGNAFLSRSRSLFPRTWQTLPTYLPFYLLLIVVSYAGWQGATAITVISPFHASTPTGLP